MAARIPWSHSHILAAEGVFSGTSAMCVPMPAWDSGAGALYTPAYKAGRPAGM